MYQMSQMYCTNCIQPPQFTYRAAETYSPLEAIANSSQTDETTSSPKYSVSAPLSSPAALNPLHTPPYHSFEAKSLPYQNNPSEYNFFKQEVNYNFIPDNFLKPGKLGMFVGKAEDIREHIEKAFELMFHEPFPNDIKIAVCDEKLFRKLAPHAGTIGLSINRRKQGLLSEIFVLNDFLGRVMLTIGHELGHVLTETLKSPHDEEAKAYAFSLAWMRIIKENNIAGLQEAIVTECPAENGLHNVAFFFVEKLLKEGRDAWKVYCDLVTKVTSANFRLTAESC